tara:strand:+ start:795 stop:1244 length:450 start_codon:yes stop_codon:yes gene_type:complete
MNTKRIIIKLKNQIIQDDIDLSSFDVRDLRQWLVASYINQLCDSKIFIDQVTAVPVSDKLYSTLFKIFHQSSGDGLNSPENPVGAKKYEIEFGIVCLDELNTSSLSAVENRLSLVFFSNNNQLNSIFESLNEIDYNIITLERSKVLIMY